MDKVIHLLIHYTVKPDVKHKSSLTYCYFFKAEGLNFEDKVITICKFNLQQKLCRAFPADHCCYWVKQIYSRVKL